MLNLFVSTFEAYSRAKEAEFKAYDSNDYDKGEEFGYLSEIMGNSLDGMRGLLSMEALSEAMKGMITADVKASVRSRALELVAATLQEEEEKGDRGNIKGYLGYLPALECVVFPEEKKSAPKTRGRKKKTKNTTVDMKVAGIDEKQSALLSIDALARQASKGMVDKFLPLAQRLTSLIHSPNSKQSSNELSGSALLCIATIISEIEHRSLPLLPKLMPPLLEILDKLSKRMSESSLHVLAEGGGEEDKEREAISVILLSALTVLETVTRSLPKFVHPFLPKMVPILTGAPLAILGESDGDIAEATNRAVKPVGEMVPMRVILPLAGGWYTNTVNKSRSEGVRRLFSIFEAAAAQMKTPKEVARQYKKFIKLYLIALDMRRQYAAKLGGAKEVEKAEDSVISGFLSLVMKLNETQLRAVFLAFVQWVSLAPSRQPKKRSKKSEDNKNDLTSDDFNPMRTVTLLRVSQALSGRLQAIFTPYLGHITEHMVYSMSYRDPSPESIIPSKSTNRLAPGKKRKRPNSENSPGSELLAGGGSKELGIAGLDVLRSWVTFDPDHTFDKNRLERVCGPMVSLLETAIRWFKEEDSYFSFIDEIFIPTAVSVTRHVSDHNLWKIINHAILEKGESKQAKVRRAAVRVVSVLYEEMGEQYLVLLPETVPFIAERMEDTDDKVEKEVERLISVVEKLSGEDLDSYLR
ncbi:hypothetical protein AAMO2058_000653000 [Amorphochlora amoebiformis]